MFNFLSVRSLPRLAHSAHPSMPAYFRKFRVLVEKIELSLRSTLVEEKIMPSRPSSDCHTATAILYGNNQNGEEIDLDESTAKFVDSLNRRNYY